MARKKPVAPRQSHSGYFHRYRITKNVRMVVNGAGAASIACVELLKSMGLPHNNVVLCDTKGVIYQGRTESMNQWKSAHAVPTKARTLREAMEGADVFFGLSAKDAVDGKMAKSMADKPILFAMANPDPEITPEDVRAVRSDAIIATGRSDYPNQVNNVLGFPFIFRGALDCGAMTITDAMEIAVVRAIAELAQAEQSEVVAAAYAGATLSFGPEYLIPKPFDPRLIEAAADLYRTDLSGDLAPSLVTEIDSAPLEHKALVFRNQQLEQVLRKMQEDNEYRFQSLGAKAAPAPAHPAVQQPVRPTVAPQLPQPQGTPKAREKYTHSLW